MKPSRMYTLVSVMCHCTCIAWVKCSVISTPANSISVINEAFRRNTKSLRAIAEDERIWRSIGFEMESPDWITSRKDAMIPDILDDPEEAVRERNVFVSGENKCSRYCIESNVENSKGFRNIDLFWSANGTNGAGILGNSSAQDYVQLHVPEFQRNHREDFNGLPKNCQIYLDLNCNTDMENPKNYITKASYTDELGNQRNKGEFDRLSSNSNSWASIKLVEQRDSSGYTNTKFLIDKMMRRVSINVIGNVSHASLQIPTNATAPWSGIIISLTRKNEAKGVRINAHNAPPGEWCIKLTGEENSRYLITVEAFVQRDNGSTDKLFIPEPPINEPFTEEHINGAPIAKYSTNVRRKGDIILNEAQAPDFQEDINSKLILDENQYWNTRMDPQSSDNRKTTQERSLEDSSRYSLIERDQAEIPDTTNPLVISSSTENILSDFIKHTDVLNSYGNTMDLPNSSRDEKIFDLSLPTEERQKIQARSSIGSTEDLDVENSKGTEITNNGLSLKVIENSDNQELSEGISKYTNDDIIEKKRMVIDVNRKSNLLVTPGTIHRVVFDVTNSCVLPVRYALAVKSSHFRVYNVQPSVVWIYPGQTSQVAVDLVVPNNVSPDTANLLTLQVQGTEIKEKSVYVYVGDSLSKITDNEKPTMEYSFNSNCAGKLEKDQCFKTHWSLDVTVRDNDSGLKSVISSPNEIYPRTDFVGGTRNPVTFYYSATCCDKTVKITAIDLLNNYNTLTIDVTAWNNLSDAEIAAITVGVLALLLLIILIILIIMYCIRRKRSHDLPYSQRYGSRPPAQAERTSF